VHVTSRSARLLGDLPHDLRVWASHGDYVEAAPPGFTVVATSANAPVAAMEAPDRRLYGLLFHPEVAHTDRGLEILRHFAFDVCGCTGDWTMASFVDEATSRIRQQVGAGRVVCGLSGGVDSTVAAVLIHRAVGDRLTCIFVDNGVLRQDEAVQVQARFRDKLKLPLEFVDASDEFLTALAGVTDPERKRKIIGGTFIDVFEKKAAALGSFDFLAQGTPSRRHRIGLRHRAVCCDQEPPQRRRPAGPHAVQARRALRELFKDEVRRLGRDLGLDEQFVVRQPFPARASPCASSAELPKCGWISCAARRHRRDEEEGRALQDALAEFRRAAAGAERRPLMGDARTYEATIAVRAVDSKDGMTADWAWLPHERWA
jgi:GMP synthase (glutamine-hydrolysing)